MHLAAVSIWNHLLSKHSRRISRLFSPINIYRQFHYPFWIEIICWFIEHLLVDFLTVRSKINPSSGKNPRSPHFLLIKMTPPRIPICMTDYKLDSIINDSPYCKWMVFFKRMVSEYFFLDPFDRKACHLRWKNHSSIRFSTSQMNRWLQLHPIIKNFTVKFSKTRSVSASELAA